MSPELTSFIPSEKSTRLDISDMDSPRLRPVWEGQWRDFGSPIGAVIEVFPPSREPDDGPGPLLVDSLLVPLGSVVMCW